MLLWTAEKRKLNKIAENEETEIKTTVFKEKHTVVETNVN
jgi:hypothetical protein